MSKDQDHSEKPAEFYREQDVLGLDKPAPNELTKPNHQHKNNLISDQHLTSKKPWVASILNFFLVGLGHGYAGKYKKGFLLYIVLIIIVLSIRFIAFEFYVFVGLIVLIILYYLYAIVDGFLTVKRNSKVQTKKLDKWYIYSLIIFLQAFLLELIPKFFLDNNTLINFASIPSSAMSPTLRAGDYLALKKTKTVQQSDVIIFKWPPDTNTMYVKRCIGTPGDNLEIKDGKVFVNNKMIDNANKLKYRYIIQTTDQSINQRVFDRLNITDHYQLSYNSYEVFLTDYEAGEFSKISIVRNVKKMTELNTKRLYPQPNLRGWTADNYGPIYIPKKGDTIKLTKSNIDLYGPVIQYENERGIFTDTEVKIDTEIISDYTFKYDHYFVLGDSRHNSEDSRYWGFVSEKHIIGKGLYLYWATNTDRIGKNIDKESANIR